LYLIQNAKGILHHRSVESSAKRTELTEGSEGLGRKEMGMKEMETSERGYWALWPRWLTEACLQIVQYERPGAKMN
jgi:hypothetical protein